MELVNKIVIINKKNFYIKLKSYDLTWESK